MANDLIRIIKDISESQAFYNCIDILESFELESKQFQFTENYIKWLLNKFNMPFVYLEPFEDVPPDENPSNTAAFALTKKCLISVPIKTLQYNNLHKHLGYIAHELKHVSDFDYYTSHLLLGKEKELYKTAFTDGDWNQIGVLFDDDDDPRDNFYYLNEHEIGSFACEYFYTNMFLRLALASVKSPYLKKVLNSRLNDCLTKGNSVNEHVLVLKSLYTDLLEYKRCVEIIKLQTRNTFKNFHDIAFGKKEYDYKVFVRLLSLLSLYPDKKTTTQIAKIFCKQPVSRCKTTIQSECLQLLSILPWNELEESDLNKYLLDQNHLYYYLLSSFNTTALVERFLFINGTSALNESFETLKTNSQPYWRYFAEINKVIKNFEEYNIVGLKNMPNGLAKKLALKLFVNTKNFKLSKNTLNQYNTIFKGTFYTRSNKLVSESVEKTK